MQTDASGSDSASSLEDADSEGKDDTAMAQERPVKRKAAEAGASADLHPGKRKHKRKHKSSRHQGHRAGVRDQFYSCLCRQVHEELITHDVLSRAVWTFSR